MTKVTLHADEDYVAHIYNLDASSFSRMSRDLTK